MAPTEGRRTVGILALQGAFEEHEASFGQLSEGLRTQFQLVRVNKAKQLDECDSLVIPGGESTTMKIIGNDNSDSFFTTLKNYVHGGEGCDGRKREARPVWGTCAGCILLSDDVCNSANSSDEPSKYGEQSAAKRCKYGEQIGGLDVSTCRNFFGRQADSFEGPVHTDDSSTAAGKAAFNGYPAVFIRAPAILKLQNGTRALARVRHPTIKDNGDQGVVVAAESDTILVTCFHPELSDDHRIHHYFVENFVLKH